MEWQEMEIFPGICNLYLPSGRWTFSFKKTETETRKSCRKLRTLCLARRLCQPPNQCHVYISRANSQPSFPTALPYSPPDRLQLPHPHRSIAGHRVLEGKLHTSLKKGAVERITFSNSPSSYCASNPVGELSSLISYDWTLFTWTVLLVTYPCIASRWLRVRETR